MAVITEAQREALKSTKKATCWDPLHLMVADVAGKPEIYSKTVDQVTTSSVAPSALVMLNAGEMVKKKTKEDEHWSPNFKLIRKSGGVLAQVQTSLQFQEFQGKKRIIIYHSNSGHSIQFHPILCSGAAAVTFFIIMEFKTSIYLFLCLALPCCNLSISLLCQVSRASTPGCGW